jgi:hypothetical protein
MMSFRQLIRDCKHVYYHPGWDAYCFYDETGSEHGPFTTRVEAVNNLYGYIKWLNNW